ncbi:hypothetical protein [Paraburkholderia sp. SIMBA_054]|uniref:hypothetical protein n=1 Tax=Paraburkholderia sp. SIMBA_054 TaxID=3085795 RepID=UPI003979FD3F
MMFTGLILAVVIAGVVAIAGYSAAGFFIAALATIASIGLQYAGAGEPLRIVVIDGSAALLLIPACLWAVGRLLRVTADLPRV